MFTLNVIQQDDLRYIFASRLNSELSRLKPDY